MKPATHTLADLFGAAVRYIVPLYQRPYVWKKETHWRPLWEDVTDVVEHQLESSQGTSSHFLGAVVLEQQDTSPGEATRRLVIDGQQRLTTLQLLLAAASEEAEKAGAEREARLLRRLTHNDEDLTSGDDRFKVWPTNANQVAFRAVMGQTGGPDDAANTIHEAHAFFRQAIRLWSRQDHPTDEELLRRFEALRVGLDSLLQVVSINLEPGDNSQVIFETLNARGTPLLAMDLVKNAVFYRASTANIETDPLHDEVWEPELGQAYWREPKRQGRLNRPRAELFLMHWLAMKLGRIVSATELFTEFRTHVLNKTPPEKMEELVRELCRDAAVMRSFDAQPPGSVEERFFRHLDVLDTTTVLPVVLLLYCSPSVELEVRHRALAAIESWLVRRMLAGLTTKNYNNVGAALLDAANRDLARADEQIIDELAGADVATQVWPRDAEVLQLLVTRGLYGWVAQRRVVMLLAAVELERRRVSNKTENVFTLPAKLTIEHVMPQKWREHWALPPTDDRDPAEVEASRDAVLHRLGNLTLTSGPLNSSLSNAAWEVKRGALQSHSLLLLNSELASSDHWDVANINQRGYALALEICAIWPPPEEFERGSQAAVIPTLEEILATTVAAAAGVASGPAATLTDLIEAGLLEEGEPLHARRQSVTVTAAVMADGRLEVLDELHDSPSSAACRAAGTKAENGWDFWLVERDGELLSLKDVRSQLIGGAGESTSGGVWPDRREARRAFWRALLEEAASEEHSHAGVSPSTDSWLSAGSGRSGVHFTYNVRQYEAAVQLVIEGPDSETNVRIYEALYRDRDDIEREFGEALAWDRLEGRKRCFVGRALTRGGYRDDETTWPEIQREMIDAMSRLERVFRPRIKALHD